MTNRWGLAAPTDDDVDDAEIDVVLSMPWQAGGPFTPK